jgi:hypothetical protein
VRHHPDYTSGIRRLRLYALGPLYRTKVDSNHFTQFSQFPVAPTSGYDRHSNGLTHGRLSL